MALTTPNRHYPYPVDSDAVDVAGDIELLAKAIDTDVAAVMTGPVGKVDRAGDTMTGALILPAVQSTNANAAVHRGYVNGEFVSLTGDTMTGALTIGAAVTTNVLRLYSSQQNVATSVPYNSPHLSFYNFNNTIQQAYIQGTPTALNIISNAGDVVINSGGGQVRTSDAIYCTGASRFSGGNVSILGTGGDAYVNLYGASTNVDTVGTRSGYMGLVDGNMHFRNEALNNHMYFACGGYQLWHTDVPVAVSQSGLGPYERMRIDTSGNVMIGTTSITLTTEGVVLRPNGSITASRGSAGGSVPFTANYQNSADGNYFIQFTRNGSTVGRIEQTGTTGTAHVSGSDRRMKTITGPIDDGVERIKAFKPYRVTWIDDPSRGETDAFIADEVQPIVPEAVFGEPDAVDEEDNPVMQGMDYSKLITVTIAALQDVIARVEALEAT